MNLKHQPRANLGRTILLPIVSNIQQLKPNSAAITELFARYSPVVYLVQIFAALITAQAMVPPARSFPLAYTYKTPDTSRLLMASSVRQAKDGVFSIIDNLQDGPQGLSLSAKLQITSMANRRYDLIKSIDRANESLAKIRIDLQQLTERTKFDSFIQFCVAIGALVGGFAALRTYSKSSQVKRAEWLQNLYSSFFEQKTYSEMRRILDYKGEKFTELIQQLSDNTGEQHTLRESLVDYLNFFEFIASLWKVGQLDISEILMLFDYYLRCLNHNSIIREYVRIHGFEGLNSLIDEAEKRYEKKHGAPTSLLFVYGTLMSDNGQRETDLLARHASKIGTATFRGKMYLVKRPDGTLEYPGVVPSDDASDIVHGILFRLHETSELLARLDEYEECAPFSPTPHEYRREIVEVQGSSGESARAFIYIYNRSIEMLPRIKSGSFVDHQTK